MCEKWLGRWLRLWQWQQRRRWFFSIRVQSICRRFVQQYESRLENIEGKKPYHNRHFFKMDARKSAIDRHWIIFSFFWCILDIFTVHYNEYHCGAAHEKGINATMGPKKGCLKWTNECIEVRPIYDFWNDNRQSLTQNAKQTKQHLNYRIHIASCIDDARTITSKCTRFNKMFVIGLYTSLPPPPTVWPSQHTQ